MPMLRVVSSSHDSRDANFSLHVENLLSLLMVGKSESTRQTYQADIEAFGRFLGFQRPEPGVAQILDRGGGVRVQYNVKIYRLPGREGTSERLY